MKQGNITDIMLWMKILKDWFGTGKRSLSLTFGTIFVANNLFMKEVTLTWRNVSSCLWMVITLNWCSSSTVFYNKSGNKCSIIFSSKRCTKLSFTWFQLVMEAMLWTSISNLGVEAIANIRESEIAECSKNDRICNILLELFHILLTFHKKILFHICVRY
jgi:hypothetical protein